MSASVACRQNATSLGARHHRTATRCLLGNTDSCRSRGRVGHGVRRLRTFDVLRAWGVVVVVLDNFARNFIPNILFVAAELQDRHHYRLFAVLFRPSTVHECRPDFSGQAFPTLGAGPKTAMAGCLDTNHTFSEPFVPLRLCFAPRGRPDRHVRENANAQSIRSRPIEARRASCTMRCQSGPASEPSKKTTRPRSRPSRRDMCEGGCVRDSTRPAGLASGDVCLAGSR